MNSRAEFLSATLRRPIAIAFVDADRISEVEGETSSFPIVAIVDGPLAESVRILETHRWLAHVISAPMLSTPLAQTHLSMLMDRLAQGPVHHPVGANAVGRSALLASSRRREARFERMREFFSARGLSGRAVSSIGDVAEELVTNALYDAPVEAGHFKAAVSRTEDVELPPEHACEISYGIDQGDAFVWIRDPFGALSRDRLIAVLSRCSAEDVGLDESRGGAGLGLWRVFSGASTIMMHVIPGRLTDIFVRFDTTKRRSVTRAIHLFFPEDQYLDGVHGRFAADHDHDLLDESFTGFRAA